MNSEWRPTPEFYRSNKEAEQIRDISYRILSAFQELLYVIPQENQDERYATMANIELLSGELISAGIFPHMNIKMPIETYMQNPLILAQYIAGQILSQSGTNVVHEHEAILQTGEFALQDADTAIMALETVDTTQAAMEFRNVQAIMNLAATGFGFNYDEFGNLLYT